VSVTVKHDVSRTRDGAFCGPRRPASGLAEVGMLGQTDATTVLRAIEQIRNYLMAVSHLFPRQGGSRGGPGGSRGQGEARRFSKPPKTFGKHMKIRGNHPRSLFGLEHVLTARFGPLNK